MITAADIIIALNPCDAWPPDRVRAAIGTGKTATQIAALDASIADRRWVLTRLAARTDAGHRALVLWACGCAQDVRDAITDEDARDAADCAVATAVAWVEGAASATDCRDAADACDVAAAYAARATATYATYATYAAYAAYATYTAYTAYIASAATITATHLLALAAAIDSLESA